MERTLDSTTLGAVVFSVALLLTATTGGMAAPVSTDVSQSDRSASTATATTATAGNTAEVLLGLAEADGDPAANDGVTWVRTDDSNSVHRTANDSGVASANLTVGESYEVTYKQYDASTDFPTDGSPDVYALGTRTYDGDTTNSTTLPQGHNLSVTVQNESGSPIPNATVHVRHQRDGASETVRAETNESGVLVDPDSDGPGYEVTGSIDVYVQPPDDADYATNYTQLTVTNDRDLTVTLESVVNVSGTVTYPNGTAASNVTLRLITDDGDTDFQQVVTEADGSYATDLLENQSYEVMLWQANLRNVDTSEPTNVKYPRDDVADFASLGWLNTSTSDVARNYSFPVGHVLNVTAENDSGGGIENASVSLANRVDGAEAHLYDYLETDGLPTDAQGRVYHPPNAEVGLEVNETVQVTVRPPEDSSYERNSTEVTVTSDRDRTLTLHGTEESVTTSGTVRYPNGTAASNVTLRLITDDGGEPHGVQAVTDADGSYTTDLRQNRSYEVLLWQADLRNVDTSEPTNVKYPRDGVADLASLGWLNTSTSDVTRNYSFPVGHVLNVTAVDESGNSIENASVGLTNHRNGARAPMYIYLHEAGLPTDAQGRMYHPPNVGVGLEVNGSVEVTARPPENTGYETNRTEVTVTSDTDRTLVLEGTEESVTTSGTVRYPNGTTASNVTLRLISRDDGSEHHGVQAVTDADGSYTTDLQPNRSYEVLLWQADLRNLDTSEPTNVKYPRDGVADLASLGWLNTSASDVTRNYSFPVGHVLNVTTVNESGAGIENASVRLRSHENGAHASMYIYLHEAGLPTDAQGRMYHPPNAEVGLEVNGTTSVSVQPPENTSYERNGTEVSMSSDRDLTLTLAESDSLSARMVGPDATPIPSASVYVMNFSTEVYRHTSTDDDGRFAVTTPSGSYEVYLTRGTTGDGIADAWRISDVAVDGDTDAGNLTVPTGYATTLNLTDRRGDRLDAYANVQGGNGGWTYTYADGRELDRPSRHDTRTADLSNGTHSATVYDSWTHDVLGTGFVTVSGANQTTTVTVDQYGGTRVSGAVGQTVVRDVQSPTSRQTVQDVLNESVNVRLFVLNATSSTDLHVVEALPDGYELAGGASNVTADGPGQIENVAYDNGTLSFDVNGTVTEIRYQAVPKGTPASAVEFSGEFGTGTPTVGETHLPAEPNVSVFAPADGGEVSTANPTVEFVTRHPDAERVTGVEYRVDGGTWRELGGTPAIGAVQVAGLADGQHTVTVRLVNDSGVVVGDTATFTVNATA